MNRARAAWIALLLWIVSPTAWAQDLPRETTFSPAHLREDLLILRGALEEAHIGLYRYADKATIDGAFDAAISALDAPLTEPQFLGVVARLLAPIRDDHTYALPSLECWSESFGPAKSPAEPGTFGVRKVLPFYVKSIGDQLFVTHDNSRERSIGVGSQILSINGRATAGILKTLDAYLPTSGFSGTYRRRHLEQYHPKQEFNVLCVDYALFVEAPDEFTLSLARYGAEKPETVVVAALPYPEVVANCRARNETANGGLFSRARPMELTWLDDKAALLSLSSFHDWQWNQAKLKYVPELFKVFATLREKGATTLVIDLRGNEGGSAGIAIEVLSHLVSRPFQVYDHKEMKGYRFPKYEPYMRDPAVLAHFTDALFERTPSGNYRIKTSLPDETWSRPMAPSAPAHAGALYVLIDGATGSAAAQLATLIRVQRRDAVFLGEECGGDMAGPISGSYLDLRLPRTGIRVDVPLLWKVMHLDGYPSERGRGVLPDHTVGWSARDIVEGTDPVLARTRDSIARSKSPR